MTVGIFSFAVNFWIEVDNTRRYAQATINNSYLQEKLFNFYNLLVEERLIIQAGLSISEKSKAVPSSIRKRIKEIRNIASSEFDNIFNSFLEDESLNLTNDNLNDLKIGWEKYSAVSTHR